MKDTFREKTRYPLTGTENKAEAVVRHCVYMMATGKWLPGFKLPSVRGAEEEWGLNRLTVQKAYQHLVERGLVECRAKSGYYVTDRGATRLLSQHRFELENLYEKLVGVIRQSSDFSPFAVFRYMSRLSEMRTAERPDCAFVECTGIQSRGHADEIRMRLGVPVMPLTTQEIGSQPDRLPREIRTIFTTLFHYDELSSLKQDSELELIAVPIEVSPTLIEEMGQRQGKTFLLETEESMAKHIAHDALEMMQSCDLQVEVVNDLDRSLQSHVDRLVTSPAEDVVLLSPRHWGSVEPSIREYPFIKPVSFSIAENAWSGIAEAIGMPLGSDVPI